MAYLIKALTPLSYATVREAFTRALSSMLGHPPSTNQVVLALAQSALETGQWKEIYNYNVGNVKRGSNWSGDVTSYPCGEVIKGKHETFPEGNDHCVFRAYPDLYAGALDYVKLLFGQPTWRDAMLTGDPERFVKALSTGQRKYFTADPAVYLGTLSALFRQFGGVPPASTVPAKPSAASSSSVVIPPAIETPPHTAPSARSANMPDLQLGDIGSAVTVLQSLLRLRCLWCSLKLDGKFGVVTLGAVERASRDLNIPFEGRVSPRFWLALITSNGGLALL